MSGKKIIEGMRDVLEIERHALILATAWVEAMDEPMPVTGSQASKIAAGFLRLKRLSDADIAESHAAHVHGERDERHE
jgi:hypothetical protein